ncbi:MAG: hypothetical protein GX231_06140 [Tissierellia bacterium]|nr:hypothetical protein [Tissierellia bacterium]
MKLELFDYINSTLDLIEAKKNTLNQIAESLESFFTDSLFINDHFLNVNYRIKSSDSLREKILRHNLYLIYTTPMELIENLSDLIGFRIECRFIMDEEKIYKDILNLFNIEDKGGYYSNPLNSSILLKLDDKQPQIQKNGFEIYKIDGKYIKEDVKVNFELQIKSMVNVFWGDIDHRVLYKNFNYMLTEDFFKDIMSSIKESLVMIDKQLMLVYNHLNNVDSSNLDNNKNQFKALLSKMIHDIYIVKVRQELGFVVDFKKSTDLIVEYIFSKGNDSDNTDNYGDNFIKVINKINEVSNKEITFDNFIEFDREIHIEDDFESKLGKIILRVINKDFKWNLFFKILFDIEEGSNAENFEEIIHFLRVKFCDGVQKEIETKKIESYYKEEMMSYIRECILELFTVSTNIELINLCKLESLNMSIRKILDKVYSYDDWLELKTELYNKMMKYCVIYK